MIQEADTQKTELYGDLTGTLTFSLAQSFTRSFVSSLRFFLQFTHLSHLQVRRFHFVTIDFQFVLLSLSLRGNSSHSQFRKAYAKLMKAEWSERLNESSYYPCSLRMNSDSVLFYKL